ERQALVLAYEHGLSHGELAAHLAKPLGTVKTWVRRGGDKPRQRVGGYMGGARGGAPATPRATPRCGESCSAPLASRAAAALRDAAVLRARAARGAPRGVAARPLAENVYAEVREDDRSAALSKDMEEARARPRPRPLPCALACQDRLLARLGVCRHRRARRR